MLEGEHSAILSTFIKLVFVIKIFVLPIFEWPFCTGFTVFWWEMSILFAELVDGDIKIFNLTLQNTRGICIKNMVTLLCSRQQDYKLMK